MNKSAHKFYIGSFILTGMAITVLLGYNGYQYYMTPVEERFFLAEHTILKPSGTYGHAFGVIGTLMMLFGVIVYMVRKRVRSFMHLGYLKHWLEFHIFLCTVGPILIMYHTAFKFGGIVAVSFWSMTAVVISGIVGRFIYVQIPRSISGQELSIRELDELNENFNLKLNLLNSDLHKKIEDSSSKEKYRDITFSGSISIIISDYLIRKKILNEVKNELKISSCSNEQIKEILKTVKLKLITSRRIGLLKIMHKIFKYWHIVHLPFAIAMFIIMILHVIVTIAFGYKWIF